VQEKLAQQFVIPVTDTPVDSTRSFQETANLAQVFKEAGIGGN
jgi:hypothetical protein